MNGKARIDISACHKMADTGENHKIEKSYDGSIFEKGDAIYILYESLDEDTKEKLSNTIKIHDNSITIVKKGAVKSTMRFSDGEILKSDYVTPYGTFGISTDTGKLVIKTGDNINIDIEYLLYLDGVLSSECNITISTCSIND